MTFELARRAERTDTSGDRLFVSNLVDLVTGILAAELSGETQRILHERARR